MIDYVDLKPKRRVNWRKLSRYAYFFLTVVTVIAFIISIQGGL